MDSKVKDDDSKLYHKSGSKVDVKLWIAGIGVLLFGIAVICVVIFFGRPTKTGRDNTFSLTIIDTLGNKLDTNHSLEISSHNATMSTVLMAYQALLKGSPLFSTTDNEELQRMIASFNGLGQNESSSGHWVLGKKTAVACIAPIDYPTYIPLPGDNVIIAYIKNGAKDFFCLEKDEARIQISVQNLYAGVEFTQMSYFTSIASNSSLIEVLERLQESDNIRFTTVEYSGLGKMITSVNELEQNSTLKTYWALGNLVEGSLCLLSVGASSYFPVADEHIVLAYISYRMFNTFPSCDKHNAHDLPEVKISVQNLVEYTAFVNTTYSAIMEMNATLIDIMKTLQDSNSNFRFTTVEYAGLGEMITSINALEQNSTLKTYWALGKLIKGEMCLLSVGASTYHPNPDDHIILSYITYDMFDAFPSCDGGPMHDSINIEISVHNFVGDIAFVNNSYLVASDTNTTLIDIMKKLQRSNNSFKFTTVPYMYTGQGEMVTSINGLEQNSTLKTYWAPGKLVEGKICLLSVGISSYHPKTEEHFIFGYITYDMFDTFLLCENHLNISNMLEISVQNFVENIGFINSSYNVENKMNSSLINLMKKLQDTNSTFRFSTTEYSGLGIITSINELEQNTTLETYWALGKAIDGKICLLSVDARSYYPQEEERLIFAYITYTMFNHFQSCDKCFSHDLPAMAQINVRNLIANIAFVNSSYSVRIGMKNTLLNIMKKLNSTDNDFSFTTNEYPRFGIMIKSINGLRQNTTMETYWALGKLLDSKMCLLSVGTDTYFPAAGEQIIFAYITYDMFHNIPSCYGSRISDSLPITIGIRRQLGNDVFSNISFSMDNYADATLIDILNKLNDTNNNFSYTTQLLDQGLKTVITSVNGIQQNPEFFWAVGKMDDNVVCLISVGFEVFIPVPGDHILLLYFDSDTFASLPYCKGAMSK